MSDTTFTVEQRSRNVTSINIPIPKPVGEFEQWVLLRSDAHHDNPKCDQSLERRHLDQALDRGAVVIDNGDLFCAMQGKYDRRSNKSAVRPEHQAGDYLDKLVTTAADFYQPYAGLFAVMGRGNHEQSIKEKHETDLTQRLVATLYDRTQNKIVCGGYTNWIIFQFKRGSQSIRRVLWMTHGYGGGGPVTKDMIQSNRQKVYIDGVDIMMSGHVHQQWVDHSTVHYIDGNTQLKSRDLTYIKTPTYKDAYDDGYEGFEVEKGHGPRPIGAWWLRFWWDGRRQLQTDVVRAQ